MTGTPTIRSRWIASRREAPGPQILLELPPAPCIGDRKADDAARLLHGKLCSRKKFAEWLAAHDAIHHSPVTPVATAQAGFGAHSNGHKPMPKPMTRHFSAAKIWKEDDPALVGQSDRTYLIRRLHSALADPTGGTPYPAAPPPGSDIADSCAYWETAYYLRSRRRSTRRCWCCARPATGTPCRVATRRAGVEVARSTRSATGRGTRRSRPYGAPDKVPRGSAISAAAIGSRHACRVGARPTYSRAPTSPSMNAATSARAILRPPTFWSGRTATTGLPVA